MNRDEAELLAAKIQSANPDGVISSGKLKSASVGIVVHRHNTNTNEDYGIVSFYHRNPFIHYPVNFMIWLRGLIRKYGVH